MMKSEIVLLNLEGKNEILEISGNEDILSEFLDNGIELPHSCREAMCGTCAAKLLEGQVNMKENFALDKTKLNEGFVLLCQSIPVSNKVVLEYDRKGKKL